MIAGTDKSDEYIGILDGWRAFSILCVLAGHLLPLGPQSWAMNGAVAATGMVVFFNLSGFLITRMLLRDPHIPSFLVRRLFRIVPMAWVAIAILAVATLANPAQIAANLGFVANLPPTRLLFGGEHLWSLCIEVQFYVAIAMLVLVGGRRALYVLPFAGLAITALRIVQDVPISIFTWQRIDEILAGCTVAILHHHGILQRWTPRRIALCALALIPLIVASGHTAGGALAYFRPWISAAAIALTLVATPAIVGRVFRSRAAVYIATTSYALYVVHGMLMVSWLGTGDTIEKYLKRPVMIALTFGLAHLSTFVLEARMIAIGKRIAARLRTRQEAVTGSALS